MQGEEKGVRRNDRDDSERNEKQSCARKGWLPVDRVFIDPAYVTCALCIRGEFGNRDTTKKNGFGASGSMGADFCWGDMRDSKTQI